MVPAILLIDMDAFFASVEQARRPELVGRPVVVGGKAEQRGVVSTCSYEARACGVRTAMPMAQAQRLCPQAVFLPVDMQAYVSVHRSLLALFRHFTDLVEPVSIDEAFLDVGGSRRLFGTPEEIAKRLQGLIRQEHNLSCSIGIGPTKLLAKMAANLRKPGGIATLGKDDVHGRLRKLAVGELPGIGPVAEERLRDLGLTTIGRLQDAPLALLATAFPKGSAALKELAFGGSAAAVHAGHQPPKSRGHEVTFAEDVSDRELLCATLLDLSDKVMADLRRAGYLARTVVLKLRYESFHTITRQETLPAPTGSTGPVYEAAVGLLGGLELQGRRVRLLGVSVSNLSSDGPQLSLADPWQEVALNDAVDRVRAKYGGKSLRLAASHLAPHFRDIANPGEAADPDSS
jgi:DNA polymerase-4